MQLGSSLPEISFTTQNTQSSTADWQGKIILLYFYPKDDTPGCTVQAKDFASMHKSFEELGASIYGVSRDSVKSHQKFCDKFSLSFALISDESEEWCKMFGVLKEKNMYGKKVIGIERSSFVFDPSGKLVKEWRKVKPEGHAEEVLEYIRQHLCNS